MLASLRELLKCDSCSPSCATSCALRCPAADARAKEGVQKFLLAEGKRALDLATRITCVVFKYKVRSLCWTGRQFVGTQGVLAVPGQRPTRLQPTRCSMCWTVWQRRGCPNGCWFPAWHATAPDAAAGMVQ